MSIVLVCEVGLGNFTVERFDRMTDGQAKAAKLWCCWVLFEQSGTALSELAHGGVGFSHGNIRTYAAKAIQSKARDADARANAAAAAEARFAQSAAKQPKAAKPASSGPTYNVNNANGKPDITNPAAWD